MPKTCIIYPEMNQTVSRRQEHSRTRRTFEVQIQESDITDQNQEINPTIRTEK